jgi:5-methylcytosine-specific restriction endonuclease McrA
MCAQSVVVHRRPSFPLPSPLTVFRVYEARGPHCLYCRGTSSVDLDWLVPACRRGPPLATNLVPACEPCRTSRGKRYLTAWLRSRPDLDEPAVYRRIAEGTAALRASEPRQLRRAA